MLGAVLIGWAIAILGLIDAAHRVGAPAWRMLTLSIVVWYFIDSIISVALGLSRERGVNRVFLVTFLVPILASGVLGDRDHTLTAPRS